MLESTRRASGGSPCRPGRRGRHPLVRTAGRGSRHARGARPARRLCRRTSSAGTATLTVRRRPAPLSSCSTPAISKSRRSRTADSAGLEHVLGDADPDQGAAAHGEAGRPRRAGSSSPTGHGPNSRRAAVARSRADGGQAAARTCSRRGRRSSPGRGSPRRTAPASGRPTARSITVPAPLRAVMSAEHVSEPPRDRAARRTFGFRMTTARAAVPDRAGDRRHRVPGDRARAPRVYTEPSALDRAASEFADLERMVDAAETAVRGRIAGAATTCWCFRRRFPSAGWRTRG